MSHQMFSKLSIAEGCQGKVYKEQYKGVWAAVKKVPARSITREELVRECKVYETAKHNNVVALLGPPWRDTLMWNIPLELINGENLETIIFSTRMPELTQRVKATIITGMCEGLLHLHSNNIVHQDLKPDNIMVEHGTHRAVIVDMGLAKFFLNGLSSAENAGNEAYYAPEVLRQGVVRDTSSDVWAMGKIIAELLVKNRLRTDRVSPSVIQQILRGNPYCSVVSKMVETNPTKRASMYSVISDIRQAGRVFGGEAETRRANPGANPGPNPGANRATRAVVPVANPTLRQAAPVAEEPVMIAAQISHMRISARTGADGEVHYRGERVQVVKIRGRK